MANMIDTLLEVAAMAPHAVAYASGEKKKLKHRNKKKNKRKMVKDSRRRNR